MLSENRKFSKISFYISSKYSQPNYTFNLQPAGEEAAIFIFIYWFFFFFFKLLSGILIVLQLGKCVESWIKDVKKYTYLDF